MKTNNIFRTVLCILALSCALSCNNDDDPSGDVDNKAFRVKEVLSTYTDNSVIEEEGKSVLSYNNEVLIEIIEYEKENGTWEEEYKSELNYQGEWVDIINFNKEGDKWVEDQNWNMTMKIVNGRIEITKSTSDSNVYETVYNYSGDKLISIKESYDGVDEYRMEFSYNGDNPQELIEYYFQEGNWIAVMKVQYNYSEGQLTQIISSYFNNENWQFSEKYEYFYSGDKLVKIDEYMWTGENWENYGRNTNFEYNSEGLLVSEREMYSEGGNSSLQEYLYEEGRGNLKLFMEINYYNYYYPTPQKPVIKPLASGTDYDKAFTHKFLLKSQLN